MFLEYTDGNFNAYPVNNAGSINGGVLLVHGRQDYTVHCTNSVAMNAALQNNCKKSNLIIIPGTGHNVGENLVYSILEDAIFYFRKV